MTQKYPALIPAGIAITLLLLALLPMPYGYYTLLRLAVCLIAAVTAFMAFERELKWLLWPLALIGLLFNPIIPVHLAREIWGVIDLVVAGAMGIVILVLKRSNEEQEGGREIRSPLFVRCYA